MKKPSAQAIRDSRPLSVVPQTADRLAVCNVCGKPSEQLGVWRAHDERDRPIPGDRALVFLGVDHAACRDALNDHARMFSEEAGNPGHFPLLCGGCVHRTGMGCTHPSLKGNGGPGLRVELGSALGSAIICTRQGCYTPLSRAVGCAGLVLAHNPPAGEPARSSAERAKP